MTLQIGNVLIELQGLAPDLVPAHTRTFVVSDDQPAALCYHFHLVDILPKPSDLWTPVYQKNVLTVYANGPLERRLLTDPNGMIPYAVYEEVSDREIDVFFLRPLLRELAIDTIFHSCLALERYFARLGCYVLHCSCLIYHDQAVLFSGPSGIGKSTHADLWVRYIPGAYVMNGDRCLISVSPDGTYYANAWPVCGSSEICHLGRFPLRAIVFMGQSPTNDLTDLNLMQRLRLLNMQLMVNHWNPDATRIALDWMTRLVSTIDIRLYACNLTPEAPLLLASTLFPTDSYSNTESQ